MRSAKQAAAAWGSLTAVGTHAWRAPDPIEQLKAAYVGGIYTLEEFEIRVADVLGFFRAPNPQPAPAPKVRHG